MLVRNAAKTFCRSVATNRWCGRWQRVGWTVLVLSGGKRTTHHKTENLSFISSFFCWNNMHNKREWLLFSSFLQYIILFSMLYMHWWKLWWWQQMRCTDDFVVPSCAHVVMSCCIFLHCWLILITMMAIMVNNILKRLDHDTWEYIAYHIYIYIIVHVFIPWWPSTSIKI